MSIVQPIAKLSKLFSLLLNPLSPNNVMLDNSIKNLTPRMKQLETLSSFQKEIQISNTDQSNQLSEYVFGVFEEYHEFFQEFSCLKNHGKIDSSISKPLKLELGDLIWYLLQVISSCDFDLNKLSQYCIAELAKLNIKGLELLMYQKILEDDFSQFHYDLSPIMKRHYRGDGPNYKKTISVLCGTRLLHLLQFMDLFDFDLNEILKLNREKISDRKSRNVINGTGDNR